MAIASAPSAKREIFEPEHDDYRESFQKFIAAEMAPHFAEWDAAGLVPRELSKKAAAHGFMGMEIPEQYGGPGVDDWRFNAILAEETAGSGYGPAFAGPMLTSDVCLPYLMESANDEQKQRWLPGIASGDTLLAIAMTEPGTGSDLAGIRTRAKRDGSNYVINGAKTFITNGLTCDRVIVACKTSEEKHAGLSLIVVDCDTPGFQRGKAIDKLGQHASDTAELFFEDCVVSEENLLGAEGSGFFQLVSRLVPERLIIAVGAMAGCEAALKMTIDYVKERTAFGRPIGSFQNSRFAIAEMATKTEITRTFIDQCIKRYVTGTLSVEHAAMAKWYTTELLGEITDRGLQLHGGYGYTHEYPISRAWVDARITRIYGGTTEIMKELIGRSMGL